ncbi:MAG: hypothetical protein JSV45_00020 [Chromatiales bacterium]|nr:MAG: hypothetical protein JSV45_00020 [Chromatiales bacterium]
MITAIVKWKAADNLSRADILERFRKSIPVYKGHPHLVRKYICFDRQAHQGLGIYLWDDEPAAREFYAMASPIIEEETGYPPEIEFFDTPTVVDNSTGETLEYG